MLEHQVLITKIQLPKHLSQLLSLSIGDKSAFKFYALAYDTNSSKKYCLCSIDCETQKFGSFNRLTSERIFY